MEITTETITPEIAQRYLEKNINNRNISDRKVQQYARDMLAGDWRLNGDPIRFNTDGNLIDGQHRLEACVDAKVEFQCVVVRGLDETTVMPTIDSGKSRTGADVLTLRGYKYAPTLSGGLKTLHTYKKIKSMKKSTGIIYSNNELLKLLDLYPGMEKTVQFLCSNGARLLMPPSLAAALHYLFSEQDPALADQFFEKLKSGIGLNEETPILILRGKLIQNAASLSKLTNNYIAAITVKAWKLFRANKPCKSLSFRETGDRPETFPVI